MQEMNIITISDTDAAYPPDFKQLKQPVKQFYAVGNIDLLHRKPRLGVVGSRQVTPYGKEVTNRMTKEAARAGATIVSGLALGVDGIAHQAALDVGGSTIAVLPSSLHTIYPASHHSLARQIVAQNGLLITEFSKDESPMRHYFIQRNRLIASLSEILLVTEAAEGSGSRHTVDFMAESKTMAAVPGDINKPSSFGPNKIIKEGGHPIVEPGDLLSLLGLNENLMKPKYRAENEYEAAILTPLNQQPLSFNEIQTKSCLQTSQLNVHLTMLELKGAIEPSSNNMWRLSA